MKLSISIFLLATSACVAIDPLMTVPKVPITGASRQQLDERAKAIIQITVVDKYEDILGGELLSAFTVAYDKVQQMSAEENGNFNLDARLIAFDTAKNPELIIVGFYSKLYEFEKSSEFYHSCHLDTCYYYPESPSYIIEVSRESGEIVNVKIIAG